MRLMHAQIGKHWRVHNETKTKGGPWKYAQHMLAGGIAKRTGETITFKQREAWKWTAGTPLEQTHGLTLQPDGLCVQQHSCPASHSYAASCNLSVKQPRATSHSYAATCNLSVKQPRAASNQAVFPKPRPKNQSSAIVTRAHHCTCIALHPQVKWCTLITMAASAWLPAITNCNPAEP